MLDDGEGDLTGLGSAEAIGDGGAVVDADGLARFEAECVVVGEDWFDAEDADGGVDFFSDQGAAGEETATAEADEEGVEAGDFFEQFEGEGALARDGPGMVVGRDESGTAVLGDLVADGFALF